MMSKRLSAAAPFLLAALGGASIGLASAHGWAWVATLAGVASWTGAALRVRTNLRHAMLVTLTGSLAMHACGVPWIFAGLDRHGANGPLITGILAVLFFGYLSAQHAVSYAVAHVVMTKWFQLGPSVRMAMAWTLGWALNELLRLNGVLAFPYLQLGTGLLDAPGVQAWMPVVGAEGVSVLVVGAAALLISQAGQRSWPLFKTLGIVCLMWSLLAAAGEALSLVEWTRKVARPPLVVHAMQSNFTRDSKWDTASRDHAFEWLSRLSLSTQEGEIIVTPEFFLYDLAQLTPSALLDAVAQSARANKVDILVGVPYAMRAQQGTQDAPAQPVIFNSIVHFSPERTDLYGKERLVAFGEYAPFAALLAPLYRYVFDFPLSNMTSAPKELADDLYLHGQTVGTAICFEMSFPMLMAERARDAAWLLTVSNDAWFDSMAHYEQSHRVARARAAEFGRMTLRVNNVGKTALIDSHGNTISQLPVGVEAVMHVQAYAYEGTTPYAWIARRLQGFAALSAITMSAVLSSFRKRKFSFSSDPA